ncbi:hypothetical protein CCAX7_27860 [Capsulimonas corticalis]|uniref:Uncharacterized protein n=1 Tax=Capsulimonas corticalis TaxID=2219043 RepID=A0A402CTH8_9BACT|nr:hypothetical protein [Capsulimonas corticalis]BDI30735.1 hypothetical protein CCAX7_27860 [Capsulimonas corticalis]
MNRPSRKTAPITPLVPEIMMELPLLHQLRLFVEDGADQSDLFDHIDKHMRQQDQDGGFRMLAALYLRWAFFLSIKDTLALLGPVDQPTPFGQSPMDAIHETYECWSGSERRSAEIALWDTTIHAIESAAKQSLGDLRQHRSSWGSSVSDDRRHAHSIYRFQDASVWTVLYLLNSATHWDFAGLLPGEIRMGNIICPICASSATLGD